MMRYPFRLLVSSVLVLAGCTPVDRSGKIIFEGQPYRLVTGKHLRAAIVGQKIRYPDPYRMGEIVLTSSIRCDGFYPDGSYLTCGDRVPRRWGKYTVSNDRVCITLGGPSRCYQLYQNRTGHYLLGHPGELPPVERIGLVPAADDTVAPSMR